MDRVSVVMPTYNARECVTATIDNLGAQTYSNIELIVVDDASSDDTVAVVRRKLEGAFEHDWRIIELQGNHGPSGARNIGVAEATGTWVQFLDSDDFLARDKFQLQMAICEGLEPDVSAVYSPWRQCHVDGGKITPIERTSYPRMDGRSPIMCLVGNDRPLLGAGLARRAALNAIGGFDEALRFWECEEVMFRLAKVGRLEAAPSRHPMYLWRQDRDKPYLGGDDARYRSASVAMSWLEHVLKALDGAPFHQLAAADRRDILDYSTFLARVVFRQDRAAFGRYLDLAQQLQPNLTPTYPWLISALAQRFGYAGAEALFELVRAPKTLAGRLARAMRRPGSPNIDLQPGVGR